MIVRSAIISMMCFDLGVLGESRLSLLNQSSGISVLWETEGPYEKTLISMFLGALLLAGWGQDSRGSNIERR